MKDFRTNVIKGLKSTPKHLHSKYLYDKRGDELFQKIMNCNEYYLTNCELEIFKMQGKNILDSVLKNDEKIDLIEFGPGDATKSIYLVDELVKRNAISTYIPIDISENIITLLQSKFQVRFPTLNVDGLCGEFLEMLPVQSQHRRLILFTGANIGNFNPGEAIEFLKLLNEKMSDGDCLLIGADLRKDPKTILAAYNDAEGFSEEFALNLLHRINIELEGNFNVENFYHYPVYDPGTGGCKSYLISSEDQEVFVAENKFSFEKNEPLFIEISQKYSLKELDTMALKSGFKAISCFLDSREYFTDVIWQKGK
jgi:dimethylhistidine N-methyltransferase